MAEDFVAFALERDGEPDLPGRRLAKREAFFDQIASRSRPPWQGEALDQRAFSFFHIGSRPLGQAGPLMTWLVMLARANEGEGWGVDYLLERGGFDGLGRGGKALGPRDFADLEETYHTRILREIVGLFGISYQLRLPTRAVRVSVKVMKCLPKRASYMLLLAGELMGTVAFLELAGKGEQLLEGQPEMQGRVRELMDEILVDEIGHVTFLLGSLSGWQLRLIRTLARAYARFLRGGYQGHDRTAHQRLRQGIENYSLAMFPERVLRRAFVPAQYWPTAYARPGQGAL